MPGEVMQRLRELTRECIDEMVRDFRGDETFSGRDPGDYHVHAAAMAARADILLTLNIAADFTASPEGEVYEVMHPDEFFSLVVDANPSCLRPIVEEQVAYWSSRSDAAGRRALQLDDALRAAQCKEFASRVQTALRELGLRES